MATDIITTDLTEKTTIADNDEFLMFDSEDIDSGTGLPFWKIIKASNLNQYTSNIAGRIYLESHVF